VSHAIRANRGQLFLLPPSLDDWVPAEHPVRFVRDLVESFDLPALGFQESAGEEGRPHYSAEMLVGVWVYGYIERVRSSRALERACLRDVAFLWLTGNEHPDHTTLARFFASHKKALVRLFKQVVRVAGRAGLVGFALHAVDGTKIGAASSMDTALHRAQLEKELKRLDQVVEAQVAQIEVAEQSDEPSYALPEPMRDPSRRKQVIVQALAELIQADTDHLHRNERDARVMKGRGGVVLGYNAQAMVDHDSDLIVAADVVGNETDNAQLVPMLAQTLETTGQVAEQTVADAGYASGEQFDEAERRHLPVIVATTPEPAGAGEFHKSNFQFDAERDVYLCPRGEALPFQRVEPPTHGGKSYPRRIYRCHNRECPVRGQCTQDSKGRAIKRSPYEEPFARQVAHRTEPTAQKLLGLRKEIVEHTFGIAKSADGFRRFTLRGLNGARAQWAMVCTAINLRKLVASWRAGQLALG
jgi:transposase